MILGYPGPNSEHLNYVLQEIFKSQGNSVRIIFM